MRIAADLATTLIAARALNDGIRQDEALALLDSIATNDDCARLAVLITRAEVIWRRDWLRGQRSGQDQSLEQACALAGRVGADDVTAWDLAMLSLRRDYADALVHPDGTTWFGPEGRDPGTLEELTERARLLHETAPDAGRRGWALMCRGWIADNLVEDQEAPPSYYTEALLLGRKVGELKLIFDAQRHLGDHLRRTGDRTAARVAWEESAHAAARAGHVTGVLAQQMLLAELAREQGDEAGAVRLVTETRRWAAAIGASRLVVEADTFLSSPGRTG